MYSSGAMPLTISKFAQPSRILWTTPRLTLWRQSQDLPTPLDGVRGVQHVKVQLIDQDGVLMVLRHGILAVELAGTLAGG